MKSEKIRQKFLTFFKERGHTIVPSSSLVPDDPSVLLTSAGMQQFKSYYFELNPETTKHVNLDKPIGKSAVSIQKCFRMSDIEIVGDKSHLTFFEMLGNFSFGDYFKEKAINYAKDFIEKELGLKIDYVTIFNPKKVPVGDWRKKIPLDEKSRKIWEKIGMPKNKIKYEGISNFWGPTGNEGPCGPTTEIYIKGTEVWNLVFNEFYLDKNKKLKKLKNPGVDTGLGFERIAMFSQKVSSVFETDLFKPLIKILPPSLSKRTKRIISDHARGISFLISDGIRSSNKEAGYVLKRLIRRLIILIRISKIKIDPAHIFAEVFENYGGIYPELNRGMVLETFNKEKENFQKTMERGLKEFERLILQNKKNLRGKDAFFLYQSFGFPEELMKELCLNKNMEFAEKNFREEMYNHQKISRAGAEKKFGGHGLILDTGELKASTEQEKEKVLRLHTATHLLQQALREILGNEIKQMGSDINPNRIRFDFTFGRKMSEEEKKNVEFLVNQKIKKDLPVNFVELPRKEAEKTEALSFFKGRYPEIVKVYYIGNSLENAWSKEFCGGPHVRRTSEIGKFKIIKEESAAAGIKRIRATLE